MTVDIDILLLGPFRDVVARAKEAVTNANDADDHAVDPELCKLMLKASQTVLKEGERALKRIKPLWDGQVEKYGDAFVQSLGQNDDVEEKRKKLEDLLYDFEDYLEPETFEAERYAAIRTVTRSFALSVIDFIKKTKVETTTTYSSKSPAYSALAPSKFPPLPPLPSLPRSSSGISTRSSSRAATTATTTTMTIGGRRKLSPKRLDRRVSSPPPPLPLSTPPPAMPGQSGRFTHSTDSFEPGLPDMAPIHPLRLSPSKRSHDRLNNHPQGSMARNATSRSRISRVSLDSLPPPAYTASGEMIPAPHSPLDEHVLGVLPGRSSPALDTHDISTELPSPTGIHGLTQAQQPFSPSRGTAEIEPKRPGNYTAFPISRSSTGSSQGSSQGSTCINSWVSDQAEATRRLSARRQSVWMEPPSSQATQALQSLTIPEGEAVDTVRGLREDGSLSFDSNLTPMLSQLGNYHISSSPASNPSVVASGSSSARTRTSPFSQTRSMSSIHSFSSPPAPLKTPDETTLTRISQNTSGSLLTPLILPAAALEPHQQPDEPPERLAAPAPPTSFGTSQEEWHAETRTIISDRGSASAGISVYSENSHPSTAFPQPRDPDTAIGPRSSLYALAGFCAGATQFKVSAHTEGVRKVAGHVAGVSTATARCSSCSYGHAFTELELDVRGKSPRATFPRSNGVLFRIRLLYKSHLVSQRPSEAFYGCIFCAQLGSVVHEGDATVFRSSDDLFRHLARHPQPLPDIPGVKVLYGKNILTTDPSVNDFDLWLAEDPKPLPEVPLAIDLARLPVATATKNHVQRYGEKKLTRPEGKTADQLLPFFMGARIVGIEFPVAFAGKWCTGFHDGEWGYFPSKLVELEKPRPGRLDAPPLQFQGGGGGSNVTVVTRFKWDASAAGTSEKGWLSFDKGEKITNVGWPVLWEGVGGGRDAWCWSGTNAKGRFGVFPRSHVDEATLRDDARPFTAAAGRGGGGAKSKSLFRIKRLGSIDSSRNSNSGGVVEIN